MTERVDVRAFVPDWVHIQVRNVGELRQLGSNNIRALIGYHKGDIERFQATSKELDSYVDLLQGKTGADISKAAKRYDNPQFGPGDLTFKEGGIEPTRQEDKDRKGDSTTFNKCGWCKYRGPGNFRGEYMINGGCDLLLSADLETNHNKGVNTDCSFPTMSATDIARVVERYKEIKRWVKEDTTEKGNLTAFMEDAAKASEPKPYLPQLRPYDLFNIGDEIVVWTGNAEGTGIIGEPRLISGKVIDGYRHHDGCVSYVADEVWHKGAYGDGKGGGSGASRADILLKSEFDYLIQHPRYLEFWLRQIEEYKSNEYDGFKSAIRALANQQTS